MVYTIVHMISWIEWQAESTRTTLGTRVDLKIVDQLNSEGRGNNTSHISHERQDFRVNFPDMAQFGDFV